MPDAMFCLRILLSREQVLEKYGIPESAAEEFFSRVEPSFGSGESARYVETDVDQQLDQCGWRDRPVVPHPKSSLLKEGIKVIASENQEPWERIANGIDRLIEALAPKAPPTTTAIQMLTPEEASKQMRLNVQTVMKWCRQGKMGTKCGRKWLIDPKEVDRYLRGVLMTKGPQVAP